MIRSFFKHAVVWLLFGLVARADEMGNLIPASRTVTQKPLIHTMQVLPRDTSVSVKAQTEQVLDQLTDIVKSALDGQSHAADSFVKLNLYAADNTSASESLRVIHARMHEDIRPAISVVTTRLADPKAKVAADVVVLASRSPQTVERLKGTSPTESRAAILPVGPRVYISGQAEKGDGSLADATRQTMASLKKTLDWLGCSMSDVVHLKAFLTPMDGVETVRRELAAAFPGQATPPVSYVEWESSLPIEIELIALAPALNATDKSHPIEFLTPPWMKPSPVFCRVVRVNHPATIYISGLYGSTEEPDSADEVRDLYGSLRRITNDAGSDLLRLAKATYYVSTDEVSNHLNTVRPEFYDPQRPPSASKAKVSGTGRAGRTITLDMIAVPR